MDVAGTPIDGEVPPSRGKSRQKIMKLKEEMNSQKFVPKTSNEVQADRIRQLKESYDLAMLKAEELNRHPVSNLYQKVHGDRAKRVYSALSSLIYSTISFSKAKGLEDYIRQNAVTLPAALIDLNEWEYVLQNVHDCREAMVIRSTPRAEIPFDLRKKMELCQYLATQPVRNTKDEIQILRQSVVEQLNAFYGQLHQSMNMVLYVVEQIKDLNRKDESLAKIRRLEEEVDSLQQDVIAERLNGQDKLKDAEKSYALEADRLNGIIKENTATYKRTKAEMEKAHEEEVQTLRNQVEALTRDLMQADDKIRTRDRKLAGQAQVIQDLEETLARERAVSKRLKDLQEADIIAVTSSLTSDLVVSQAVNIATYFKEFREPDKVVQALRDFEAMKVDMQQLQLQHQTVKEERTAFAERVAGLEHDVEVLQRQLMSTEATLASTRSEYATEQARWEEEKQSLTSSWQQTQQQRESEASAAQERQTALEAQVTHLSAELARVSHDLETTTHENASLKTQNETLHRENQELRIQILEKDNERIVALQQHMDALVTQQEALKAQLDRSNAEKDQLLKESLQQEDAKIGALQDFVGGLTHELDKMKDNMESIKQTNKREAEILATETDKVNALHAFAIDLTTQILDIKTTVDHLTHEKDIVLQLIKLGEIIRAEQEPRVITLRHDITTVEQRVMQLQGQLATMHAGIDAEHLSESMKQQHQKLLTLSKNLDRLLWEITTLKTTVEEGILPHELEPNAALHAIKKLETQLMNAQTKLFAAEDTATHWQTQHSELLRTLHDKETEMVALTQQNTQHLTMLTQAAGQIHELIGVIEGETANALELFQTIQLIEEELLQTQEKLTQSEAMALALTEQIRQVTARKHEMPVIEHEQIVAEMEAETQRWIEKATALEAALVKARTMTTVSPLTVGGVGSGGVSGGGGDSTPSNGAAARRRSVGFADNRNEVIVIQEAAGQATVAVAGEGGLPPTEAAAATATAVAASAEAATTAAEAVVTAPEAVENTATAVAVSEPAAAPSTVVEDAASAVAAVEEKAPTVSEHDEAEAPASVEVVNEIAKEATPAAVPEVVATETPAEQKATMEESVAPEIVETAAAASPRDVAAAASTVPSLPLSAAEVVPATAAAAVAVISSARSVNSASSAGSVGSRSAHTRGAGSLGGANGGTSATPRTAAHYMAQQQTLNVVKEAMIQMYSDPASKRTSATSSPRLRPSSAAAYAAAAAAVVAVDDAPETAIEPAAAGATAAAVDEVSPLPSTTSATSATDATAAVVVTEDALQQHEQHQQHAHHGAAAHGGGLALDEDFMVACPGTVQGETGWYLSHGQYFYFVLDATTHEFLLLCGPLSAALYEAARDEDAQHPHGPSHGPSTGHTALPSLLIDRMAVHATRFHLETLLQDIQERDEALIQLQGADEDNQTQQRDIGILLGKLAEYEQQIYALKQYIRSSGGAGAGAAPAAMVPGSALEGNGGGVGGPTDTDIFSPPLSPSPVKLQRQATVEALDAMPLLLPEEEKDNGRGSGGGGEAPSAKAATSVATATTTTATEAMTPEMAGAVQKLTSVARGFLARQRVQQLKLYRLAEETGVLVAMGNTKQGESGWYCGPNGQIFYFVLHNGQWIYAAGPIPGEDFRRLLKDALAVQRKVTSGGAASRAVSIADGGSGSGQAVAVSASPLLQKCPFVLSGIHGDLAESGEVYLNLETLRLHLSLNVEDLMVALQQNTLAGGGMVSGRAPQPPIFEEGDVDGASIGGRSGGSGGGGDENDGEWLMRYANAAPAGRSPGPDDAASASSASMKQSSSKKKTVGGGGVGGGASVESSVLSINDDSVDSFEDTTGSVRAALSAKSAAL